MITCIECIERMKPIDPRVPIGRYHHSTCDYFCDKPDYYRELEAQQPPETVIVHRHSDMSAQDNDLLQQTALKVRYLLKKVLEKKPFKGIKYE